MGRQLPAPLCKAEIRRIHSTVASQGGRTALRLFLTGFGLFRLTVTSFIMMLYNSNANALRLCHKLQRPDNSFQVERSAQTTHYVEMRCGAALAGGGGPGRPVIMILVYSKHASRHLQLQTNHDLNMKEY